MNPRITKAKWLRYRKIQESGCYMLTEALSASIAAYLTRDEYLFILKNYAELSAKHEPERKLF